MITVKQYMTNNDCYKAGRTITPKGIMVHSTAAPGVMASDWYARWNKPGVQKCVHAFVDDQQAVQYLPWTMRGWHCGSGSKGSANNTHIGFEICEDKDWTAEYFAGAWANAVELTVYLCRQYNLTAKDVISHKEGHAKGIASNHGDPDHWWSKFGRTMDDFRREVAQAMAGEDPVSGGEQPSLGARQVNTPGDTLNVRSAANASGAKLGELAHGSRVDIIGLAGNGWVRVRQDNLTGWVNGKYLTDYAAKPELTRILKLKSPNMRGEDVRWAQARLNALGYNSGTPDGIFGPNTDKAVKAFQGANGLSKDGDIGPKTWAKL